MGFTAYLVNCFIYGEHLSSGLVGGWPNQIDLHFAGHDISIIQRPKILGVNPVDYRGEAVSTTKVVVHNIGPKSIPAVVEKVHGLATLLSMITCSQVVMHRWRYDGARPHGKAWSAVARTGFFIPMLNIRRGRAVREFLEQSWPAYFDLEVPRKLRVAIDYFVSSQVLLLPLELKLLTMFVLFENLKSTFASSMGYEYKRGYYWRASHKRWTFESLLMAMFNDVGMNPEIGTIKTLRDELIHSGVSEMPYDEQRKIYALAQDLAREYFMRLLRFSGSFSLYSGRGKRMEITVS